MMFKKLLHFFLIAVLLTSISCSKGRKIQTGSSDGEVEFSKGKSYYDSGKWGKAIKVFSKFIFDYSTSPRIAEATFILADSYFNDGQYQLAIENFRRVMNRYPESGFAEKSELMIAEALFLDSPGTALDQDKTREALEAFKSFITYNPSSEYLGRAQDGVQRCREKLAKKEYNSALLYFKLGRPESVILYSDIIADEYSNTSYAPMALLLKGRALFEQMNKPDEAREVFEEIVKGFPGTEPAKEAQKIIEKKLLP